MVDKDKLPLSAKIIFLLGLVGVILIAVTAFSPLKSSITKGDRINILLLGISEFDYTKFAEVIKLLSYEPETGFMDIISIPRDTMISVPREVTWRRIQKLDEIYFRYYRNSSSADELFEKFRATLNDFLDDYLSIDYYIQVDYRAFIDFIDVLGGIEIEVLRAMKYDDYAQNLHISISTGIHQMNGEKALKYVRYRDRIRGDIGRLSRQREFLLAVAEKLKSPATILKIPRLLHTVIKNVDTNLTLPDILIIVDELMNFEMKNFRIQMVPGIAVMRWGKSYWEVDSAGFMELLDVVKNSHLVNFPAFRADKKSFLEDRITVEVWNATKKQGFAQKLTRYLRKRNVDVKDTGNFGTYKKYTQIISRTGDLKLAQEVADVIGYRNIRTELDSSRMVDVSIVIGNDFKPLWRE